MDEFSDPRNSHTSEPLMAPKLPNSQIFKGRAYELKYLAYRFCLNKKQANLLLYLGVIFSKPEKNITSLKFARIQKPFHSEFGLRMYQKHNRWIHLKQIFLYLVLYPDEGSIAQRRLRLLKWQRRFYSFQINIKHTAPSRNRQKHQWNRVILFVKQKLRPLKSRWTA